MNFIAAPVYLNSSQVPDDVLAGIVSMGLGKQPRSRLYEMMCIWANRYGGDVIIKFPEEEGPLTMGPKGYRLTQLRFVAPHRTHRAVREQRR